MAEDKTPSVHKLGMTKGLGGKAKRTKKQRKYGRNAKYCTWYAATHQREKNRLKRLLKHIKRHVADLCALQAVQVCKTVLGLR
jgi:hypothetical protein